MAQKFGNESSFVYQPLNRSRQEIRLIRLLPPGCDPNATSSGIHCEVFHAHLDDKPQYEALSYVWGSSDKPCQVLANGQRLEVTENLYIALQHLRRGSDRPRTLWIDSICIDQQQLEEKSQQVGIIGKIFRRAEKTLIWLGPDSSDGLATATINKLLPYLRTVSLPQYGQEESCRDKEVWVDLCGSLTATDLLALDTFMTLPYWGRHWVVQEVVLARTRVILYGESQMVWNDLDYFKSRLSQTVHRLGVLEARHAARSFAVFLAFFDLVKDLDTMRASATRPNLLYLWDRFGNFSTLSICSDPRDKVFGLQTVFSPNLRCNVDYALPTWKVYVDFVRCWAMQYKTKSKNRKTFYIFSDSCVKLASGMGILEIEQLRLIYRDLDAYDECMERYGGSLDNPYLTPEHMRSEHEAVLKYAMRFVLRFVVSKKYF